MTRAAPAPSLAAQLEGAARCLAEVARGHPLDGALERLPSDLRPGVQAIAYGALRDHGPARVLAAGLVERPPAPPVLALLHVALALVDLGAGQGLGDRLAGGGDEGVT